MAAEITRQEQSRILTWAVGPRGLCFAHCPLSLRTTCPPGEAVATVRPLRPYPLAFPLGLCPVQSLLHAPLLRRVTWLWS